MEEESAAEEILVPTKNDEIPPSEKCHDKSTIPVIRMNKLDLMKKHNLPLLAQMSGIGKIGESSETAKDLPAALEMLSLPILYGLRSELIQLKACMDQSQLDTQKIYTRTLYKLRDKFKSTKEQREQNRHRFEKEQLFEEEVVEEENTEEKQSDTENSDLDAPRQVNADTIWETTELFFKPVKDLNYFDRYLQKTKPLYENQKMKEVTGDHYSENFSRFGPIASQILIPSPPFIYDEDGTETSQLQYRLYSSIINLNSKQNEIQNNPFGLESDIEFEEWCNPHHKTAKIRQEFNAGIKSVEKHVIPKSERMGLTPYGSLDYETKLKLELKSLDINPSNKAPDTTNPVSRYLIEQFNSQKTVYFEANRHRKIMEDYVQDGQKIFDYVSKRAKNWNSALEIYLKQEEARAKEEKKENTDDEHEEEVKEVKKRGKNLKKLNIKL